jgi:RNA ligase (TIGR02306 family)
MRKLATLETILDLQSIPEADKIEVATVRGWKVVVGKGLYQVGHKCIYHEVDSLCPQLEPYESDLNKLPLRTTQTDNGDSVSGYLIKTIKLRGQVSQGYCVPLTCFNEEQQNYFNSLEIGADLTEYLLICKYEKPETSIDNQTSGSRFPSYLVPKTDLERLQNCLNEVYSAYLNDEVFEISYKLDGSSTTVINSDELQSVCSRNLKIPLESQSPFNLVGKPVLNVIPNGFAFQGELVSPKIQSNFEGVKEPLLYIYSVYNINTAGYMVPTDAELMCLTLGLNYVPVYMQNLTLKQLSKSDTLSKEELLELLLKEADGESGLSGKYREGLVFKSLSTDLRFKVISNRYLLKVKD